MSDLIDSNYYFKTNLPLEETLIFEQVYKPELQLSLDEKRELKNQGAEFIYLVRRDSEEIVGETYFIEVDKLQEEIRGLLEWKGKNAIYVYSTTILPKYQEKGLGCILKAYFLKKMKEKATYVIGHAKAGPSWNLNKSFGAILIKAEKNWEDTGDTYNFYKIEL